MQINHKQEANFFFNDFIIIQSFLFALLFSQSIKILTVQFIIFTLITITILFFQEYKDVISSGYLIEIKNSVVLSLKTTAITAIIYRNIDYQILFGTMIILSCIIYTSRTTVKICIQKTPLHHVIFCDNELPDKDNIHIIKQFSLSENSDTIRKFISRNTIDYISIYTYKNDNIDGLLNIVRELGIWTDVIVQDDTANNFSINNIHRLNMRQIVMKRTMDICLSLIGLVLATIVAVIIYPFVQKQAKGPLIFKQQRVGQNGKKFTLYKFRSMCMNAELQQNELVSQNTIQSDFMFKIKDDPRVFPLGNWLRKTSLDELPQFLNVLKGEMSVVGTRPPTVDEYKKYPLHYFKRLHIKPGITGMWQISGRSDIDNFNDVIALDLQYINHYRFLLDIKIILKTIWVVLRQKGSY